MRHPCEICKGACCESMLFAHPSGLPFMDEFYSARGKAHPALGVVELETRCPKLSKCGCCRIYTSRPRVCRDYKVGSDLCLKTIALRRKGHAGERILEAIRNLSQDT